MLVCEAPCGSYCDALASGASESREGRGVGEGEELRPQFAQLFIGKMTWQLGDIQELLTPWRDLRLGGRRPQMEEVQWLLVRVAHSDPKSVLVQRRKRPQPLLLCSGLLQNLQWM